MSAVSAAATLLVAGIVFVAGIAIVALISQEVAGTLPIVLKALLRLATAIIPREERDRYLHDWSTDLKRFKKRPIAGLLWTLDCFRAAALESWDLRRKTSSLQRSHLGQGRRRFVALTAVQRGQLGDLLRLAREHERASEIDPVRVEEAFVFACERHVNAAFERGKRNTVAKTLQIEKQCMQHPTGVARICASMRLDTEAVCAALLHDTVETAFVSPEEIRERFGSEISRVVGAVRESADTHFRGHDERAATYRRMMAATVADMRVVFVKLADQLHTMRTIEGLPTHQQIEKARETLDIYAPLAHRLGINVIKWELEDLAFATLHPRKYKEIGSLVSRCRDERERSVSEASKHLQSKLRDVGIEAEIAGRAKHLYSIYSKMTKRSSEFDEIYDLTAMRVIVDSVKDCYGTLGVIHWLWKPLPGRFEDFVAIPKLNMYQSLHTTVIGPGGRPLVIQIRTHEMHEMAEFGVAVDWSDGATGWIGPRRRETAQWLRSILGRQEELSSSDEFLEMLYAELSPKEVYIFTPKGEVKWLPAGATPLDFVHALSPELGDRCVGARANGEVVPLHYELKAGDVIEAITAGGDVTPPPIHVRR